MVAPARPTPAMGAPAPPDQPDPRELQDQLEEMRGWVDLLYEDAISPQPRRLAIWRERMAMYRGYQHVIPNNFLEEQWGSFDPRQEFETANQIQAVVRQAVAKKLQAFPLNPDVVPVHDSVLTRASADSSARLLRSFPRNGVIPFAEILDACYAAEIFGGAWLQVFWDPMAGPTSGGRPMGDVRVRHRTLLDVLHDPTSRTELEDRHVFDRQAMPYSTARSLWPADVFGEEALFLPFGARANGATAELLRDDRSYFESTAAAKPNQLVEVLQYWEKPTVEFPAGRLMIYSGSTILDVATELPSGCWPWIFLAGSNRAPGVRIPDGVVHNLRSPQRSLNHALSKIRENATLCVNPAILASVSSGVQTEKLDDLPGTVIRFNVAGGKPEWMNPPPMPAGLFDMTTKCKEMISDISSYSDVSQGQPQGDLSGRAILNLDQLNNLAHGPEMALFGEACARLLKTCLRVAHDRYEPGRMVRMFGVNNQWTSQAWQASDFDPDVELVVDPFSQRPASHAARFAQAVEIMQLQGYSDTPEAKAFRRHIELDVDDKSVTAIDYAQKRRACQENIQLMMSGQIPAPLFADDDDCHLAEHLAIFLSDEVQADPQLSGMLEAHMALHEQNGAIKAGVMAPPAGPEGPGGAAGPEAGPPGAPSPADGGAPQGMSTARDINEGSGQGAPTAGAGMTNVEGGAPAEQY